MMSQWSSTLPVVYPLHSQLNTADQHRVFERVFEGERKVVSDLSDKPFLDLRNGLWWIIAIK